MLRKAAPASSMQKTYDECYLICSTAIYFEGQNNEAEALRAWRNALDQIYYHNAYKMPSSYHPRSGTERALHDSLRSMELQCKERVDLLEAIRKSRLEAEEEAKNGGDGPSKSKESLLSLKKPSADGGGVTYPSLGSNTVPQASYADLPRPSPVSDRRPVPPPRPPHVTKQSSGDDVPRTKSLQNASSSLVPPTEGDPRSRTPSPEKKASGMLKTLRSNPKERGSSSKMATTMRNKPLTAAAKAASQVWAPQRPNSSNDVRSASGNHADSAYASSQWDPYTRSLVERPADPAAHYERRASDNPAMPPPSSADYTRPRYGSSAEYPHRPKAQMPYPEYPTTSPYTSNTYSRSEESFEAARPSNAPPPPPPHRSRPVAKPAESPKPKPQISGLAQKSPTTLSYMKEFPNHPPGKPKKPPAVPVKRSGHISNPDRAGETGSSSKTQGISSPIPRKAVGKAVGVVSATNERRKLDGTRARLDDRVSEDAGPQRADDSSSPESAPKRTGKRQADADRPNGRAVTPPTTDDSPDSDQPPVDEEQQEWDKKVKHIMKNLPKGVDEAAAKQIFNEIVIKGDQVNWDDVAGLDIAKGALKETVVYPFLRPDLFMGLREPARGMLLFGPPGTGKTMLARAVATESKSIFFAISASSLTSKYLGESEKLVRALFTLAKALAPSIIFVDEIDSLLGARGGSSEHEATRRIKTEFLIQWSDLQKAAAGKEDKEGDASRVLVLAATNLPWAIDEAARRRFVRRQYIPLPEPWVRDQQLRTLLAAQKHSLDDADLARLVHLTEDFSGSDITALAKDAAMGPLRSLGERLLHMKPEDIRPMCVGDFEASLVNIRPSVSRKGLQEFEDWAREFGERGG